MSDTLVWSTTICLSLEGEEEAAIIWPAAVALNTGPLEWATEVAQELAEEVPL